MNRTADPPPLDPNLEQAYAAADFVVFCPHEVVLRVGQPLPPETVALLDSAGVSQAAIVTACNPFSQVLSKERNAILMAGLEKFLVEHGFCWLPAEGRDPGGDWTPEPSLFLLGSDDELLDQLMEALEQYSVVRVTRDSRPNLVFHPLLRKRSPHQPQRSQREV